jgi:tRNA nucleotidyltransferase/poly(A) polymerase
MKMYEVGGYVRDELLGVKSKDIDYTVVLGSGVEFYAFEYLVSELRSRGYEIFLETPEYFTVRARFPRGHVNEGITADFVIARKEGEYSDGRRPDYVELGTLEDDLARRDFTMNAIAKDELGNYIDPHGGREDIKRSRIRAVGSAYARLTEDPLRAIRAIRFAVTKNFTLDSQLDGVIEHPDVLRGIRNTADERIMDELSKMFRFSTLKSLWLLEAYPDLTESIFAGKVSLDATMKTKGRG